ncbi:MAG: cytochrome C oxidase subunit IV family protein [Candidatus Sulfotelmatobacter sp.]|jgi:heme/copper-type cytochrome/quinol oxidase subunit 4
MSSDQELGMSSYIGIVVGLMLIVGIEVVLTYQHLPMRTLFASLLCLACVEAFVGIMYLMHVKYESRLLFWTIFPATLFVLVLLNYVWPDAYRMARMSVGR